MAFSHDVTVRFHEVDRAGIAFFGRVFEYCHEAFEELLVACDDSLRAVFEGGGWGMPLVHAEADYSRPMRMGDRLRIQVTVDRLGGRSIAFAFRVTGADAGELRATAKLIHAFVDLETFEPVELPDRLRDGLDRLGLLGEDG